MFLFNQIYIFWKRFQIKWNPKILLAEIFKKNIFDK